ncbi:hypothetical protein [Pseudomonas fluorescens]|uniref:hypothetical protein n=1 Tax=Pseudomonas fluorescens TaxID=294 RepID=UPI001241F3A2|nr:hypothetical protein [Pseudomonas fluorescens]VVQ33298.1 hypothetical protein PS947_03369 [Pseudomonas fluorescens]
MSNSLADNHPFALIPPQITGTTALQTPEHYHGGIPIRAVEGDLQVIINPWLVMNIGDLLELFIGNQSVPVRSKELDADDLDKRLVFRVERGFILEGDLKAFYRVTRVGQTPQDSQPTLILLVKLQRPGGFDDDTEDGHSGLKYTLKPDLPNGVTPEIAKAGVDIHVFPYENMAFDDCIICRWGSQEAPPHFVTRQQVDDPVNYPILIKFEEALIKAHGDGPDVQVTFQPIDRVGNYPDERAPWAKITRVLVRTEGTWLTEPRILVNNKPVTTVDLEQLGDNDVIVSVYTRADHFEVNDKIVVTWSGMPAQGKPIIVTPAEQCVEFTEFTYYFVIPNASVRALAKGSASVRYERIREGEVAVPSLVASVNVQGEISQLAAPTVIEASGGFLDPEADWATNEIPWYAGRKNSDQVTLRWEGDRPDGSTEYYSDSRSVGNQPENTPVLLTVKNVDIRRFNGLRVRVSYTVANDDAMLQNVRDSLPLFLQVGQALPRFEAPQVEEAQGGTLDPERVPPAGVTLIAPHEGTSAGNRVTYHWRGSGSGGSTSDFVDLTTHTAGKPVKFTVAKAFVTANLNGKVVVTYTIVHGGVLLGTSGELTLSVGNAQAEVPPPTVIEAPVYVLDPNQYQQGFTVRFDTSTLKPDDEIELTVIGRPGDGSTAPVRKGASGQPYLDFNIAAAITGANLGRDVALSYRTFQAGQPAPGETRPLTIGVLLQKNMPQPLIEGMTGEVLDIGLIEDDTKVLCDKWPFQRSGLPVWLSYVETRTDDSSRTKEQLVGVTHDQGSGLTYTTEVQWLRECKAGSTVTIVLKVGLFEGGDLVDAVDCQRRVYSVRVGFDYLTTFDLFNWDGWNEQDPSAAIIRSGEEYFFQSRNDSPRCWLKRSFSDLENSQVYELSFIYQCPTAIIVSLYLDNTNFYYLEFPHAYAWEKVLIPFMPQFLNPTSPRVLLMYIHGRSGSTHGPLKIDDIRLKWEPRL